MDFEEFFTMFNLAREEMTYQCENCGHIFNLVDVEWEEPREPDVLQCPGLRSSAAGEGVITTDRTE